MKNMKDCVSLEIAKKLKEAGWKQEEHCGCDNEMLCDHPHKLHYGNLDTEPDFTLCRYVRKHKAYGRGYYAKQCDGDGCSRCFSEDGWNSCRETLIQKATQMGIEV